MLVTYATVLYIMDNCQGTDAVIVRRSKERCCEDSSARKKVSSWFWPSLLVIYSYSQLQT